MTPCPRKSWLSLCAISAYRNRPARDTTYLMANSVPRSHPLSLLPCGTHALGWRVTVGSACPTFQAEPLLNQGLVAEGMRVTQALVGPSLVASPLGNYAAAVAPRLGARRSPFPSADGLRASAAVPGTPRPRTSSGCVPRTAWAGTNNGTTCIASAAAVCSPSCGESLRLLRRRIHHLATSQWWRRHVTGSWKNNHQARSLNPPPMTGGLLDRRRGGGRHRRSQEWQEPR